jgi:TonB dependent receptor
VSWSRAVSDAVQQPFGQAAPAAAQVPGVTTDPQIAGGIPGITIDGFFGGSGLGRLGSPDFLPKFQHTRQFEYLDTLSWMVDSHHQLKFGVDILQMKNEFLDVPAIRGALRFRNRFSGNPMADFLLGYVSDLQLSNVWVVDQRHWAAMFFVQDDWKVSSKLSLNLGLRYDFITPALEANNRQTNFVPENGGQLVFASAGSLEQRGLVKPDGNNLAPRLGLVYKLNDKTLVRGGYGIFYNLFDRVGSEDQLSLNVPGLINSSVSSTNTTPLFLLQQGYPTTFLATPNLDPAAGDLRRLRIRAVASDAPKSTIQQASLGFQREVAKNLVLSVDGIWTKGSSLASLVNLNQPANGNGALPFPNFGFVEWRAQDGRSQYKGVDVGLERRFAQGFSFGVAYTLGDSKDNTSEQLTTQGSSAFPQDAVDLDAWFGPSDYDVRHRLSINFVAELPFGNGKRWANSGLSGKILGGWTLSGVVAVRSGRPYTVNQSSNNVGQNMTGLPDLVGNPDGPKTVDQWFNVAAFQAVASGTFGNEERNQLRGPAWQSLDGSLSRRLALTSRVGATLRWDVFNVLNHTNLGLPNRNLSDPTVGTITSLAGDPRIMQFSLRVDF